MLWSFVAHPIWGVNVTIDRPSAVSAKDPLAGRPGWSDGLKAVSSIGGEVHARGVSQQRVSHRLFSSKQKDAFDER